MNQYLKVPDHDTPTEYDRTEGAFEMDELEIEEDEDTPILEDLDDGAEGLNGIQHHRPRRGGLMQPSSLEQADLLQNPDAFCETLYKVSQNEGQI